MKLTSIQTVMFRAVTGNGLTEAAAEVHGGEERLGVYAEMYWLRMRDALRADFPMVRSVLGDERFDVLVARHLRANPSTHYSLGRLGRGFSASIEEPWVADLAALEWARGESFVARDVPVLGRETLAALNEESFVRARLVPHSSLRLLKPAWDVLPVWRALEAGSAWSEPLMSSIPLVVWRKGFDVFHVQVSAAEMQALECVMLGEGLPVVCDAFGSEPEPIAAAFQAIGSWVNEGLMSRLEISAGDR